MSLILKELQMARVMDSGKRGWITKFLKMGKILRFSPWTLILNTVIKMGCILWCSHDGSWCERVAVLFLFVNWRM